MNVPDHQAAKRAARELTKRQQLQGFEPSNLHMYQNEKGNPEFWRIRMKHPETGEKFIRPMFWNGRTFKLGEPPASGKKKPLYRLPELIQAPNDSHVFITEGEQKVEALERLGLIATTSGGSSSADGADWTPLQGRTCIVWPDHDPAGRTYADAVATILLALGCDVSAIDPAQIGVREKGDVIDWLADHNQATAADVLALPRVEQWPPKLDEGLPSVELTRADKIQIRPINWVWPGWLALGKIHVLAGAPGTGKTTIALAMAAVITRGGCWPDGTHAQAGDVVIWSGEDSPADTLVPRLKAAGADLERVLFVDTMNDRERKRPFDPAADMPALERKVREHKHARLLILDSIVSVVQGDSHKNAEVRKSMQPLADLAEARSLAVLGISHFSKGTAGRDPTERVTGSLAFAAMARVVMATGKDPNACNQDGWRLLVRTKSNIGPEDGGFRYRLDQTPFETAGQVLNASTVQWGERVNGSARELFNEIEGTDSDQQGEVRGAVEWLRDTLKAGPTQTKQLRELAKEAGFAWRTVQRAMHKAGAESRKPGFQQPAVWRLKLDSRATIAPSAPSSENGAIGATADEAAQLVDPFGDGNASSTDRERFEL